MKTDLLEAALSALRNGGTLLYPTDTIWGIGCDATIYDAVDRLYTVKQRPHDKAMLILADEQMLPHNLPSEIRGLLIESHRPTTVILPVGLLALPIARNLPAADGTIGVRIPRFDFCQKLLKSLGHPIVSTSANLSGMPSPQSYGEIDPVIRQQVDYALPDDPSFHHPQISPSRIVRVTGGGDLTVIRD